MNIIETLDLVKNFGTNEALRGVSLSVERGATFGFLGPNGAGKSTAINILCTLLSPSSGIARVNGFNCMTEPAKVRASIGMVFQETTLDNELTAYENLKFHGFLYNMRSREIGGRINEVLRVVMLDDRKNDRVKTFSGGMKRRLEIARGLLHRPEVLFLDEPTLGLDPQTRTRVWEFIEELRIREGITVFMTTHYMDEAERCDNIAIIDQGEIIASGSPDELKNRVRGDLIYIETKNCKQTMWELKEKFGIDSTVLQEGIRFNVERGDFFIPKIFECLSSDIISINVKKPSLDDVFLEMTGRAIRDLPDNGGSDLMRMRRRGHRI